MDFGEIKRCDITEFCCCNYWLLCRSLARTSRAFQTRGREDREDRGPESVGRRRQRPDSGTGRAAGPSSRPSRRIASIGPLRRRRGSCRRRWRPRRPGRSTGQRRGRLPAGRMTKRRGRGRGGSGGGDRTTRPPASPRPRRKDRDPPTELPGPPQRHRIVPSSPRL